MDTEEIARKIVRDWWGTQNQLIPTSHLQNPLIEAITAAIVEVRDRALCDAAQAAGDVSKELRTYDGRKAPANAGYIGGSLDAQKAILQLRDKRG